MARPEFHDSAADPLHRKGVDYLMKNRPLWSYIPGISYIWTKGFIMGAEVAVVTRYVAPEDFSLIEGAEGF